MTSDEYKLLSIDERADVLWKNGTFLEEIIEYGKYRIMIYGLHSFFVSVYYSVKENKIEKIEVMRTSKEELQKTITLN